MIPRWVSTIRAGDPVFVNPHDNYASPLHIDDIIRQVPELRRVASVPVTVLNWGNDDCVSEREMIAYVSEVIDTPAKIEVTTWLASWWPTTPTTARAS